MHIPASHVLSNFLHSVPVSFRWPAITAAGAAIVFGLGLANAQQPAAKPSAEGIWLGTLQAGAVSLRVQVTIKADSGGQLTGALDSLDQGSMGIPCANVKLAGDDLTFDVPAVNGKYAGKLSADGNTLAGTWSQHAPLALNMTRQQSALAAKPAPAPVYDPAMPPVALADLKGVLDRDLAEALKSGELAPATGAGVAIGVVEQGVRQVFCYGAAKPDSIFEIGSITKTFTGLVLAQMVAQGKVKLDEPVRELLPPGTVAKPDGAEIRLVDLATQRSGLPRLPDNFTPADKDNPYADYGAANLYAFLLKHGVALPANAQYLYSNLGFGLLGQALSDRAGLPYPELLKQQVTGPLGMNDTSIALTADQQSRFIPGHDDSHKPAHAWDLVAMAGAGAIRSTACDMLTFVQANLHPEGVKPVGASPGAATVVQALKFSHELRADIAPGVRIALAWMYVAESGNYWHNGATGGYSSYAFFNPDKDYAGVVLLNTTFSEKNFADRLGEHISQRLAGKPAISLAP